MSKLLLGFFASVLMSTAALAQSAASPPIAEGATPSGTISLKGGAVAAGVGYVWGHGALEYNGRHHRFKLKGISVADAGAAHITAVGEVYNLSHLSDFNGNYVAADAGATVAGGGSVAYLKNEHGVVIKLHSTAVGLRFTLAAEGVNINLQRTHEPEQQ
jgi:hypothetical protein